MHDSVNQTKILCYFSAQRSIISKMAESRMDHMIEEFCKTKVQIREYALYRDGKKKNGHQNSAYTL